MWGKIYAPMQRIILVQCLSPKLRHCPFSQPEIQQESHLQMRIGRGESQIVACSMRDWTGVLSLLSRAGGEECMWNSHLGGQLLPRLIAQGLWKGRQKWMAFVDDNGCGPGGTWILFVHGESRTTELQDRAGKPESLGWQMRAFQQEVVRIKYGDTKSHGMRGRTPQDISVMTWAHGECRCHSDVSTPIQDGKSWGQQRGALFCELKSHPVQLGLVGSGPVIPNPRDTTKCPCM